MLEVLELVLVLPVVVDGNCSVTSPVTTLPFALPVVDSMALVLAFNFGNSIILVPIAVFSTSRSIG